MYEIFVANRKTEKKLEKYMGIRSDIKRKLDLLKEQPRKSNGAHPLYGKLEGKWACWLGSNLRIIYIIDDVNKRVIIFAVGSHKIY